MIVGGGIGFTVKHTRESSFEELYDLFVGRLDRMLKLGTTVIEGKSGMYCVFCNGRIWIEY